MKGNNVMEQSANTLVNAEEIGEAKFVIQSDRDKMYNNFYLQMENVHFSTDFTPPPRSLTDFLYKTSRISDADADELISDGTCIDFREAISNDNICFDTYYYLDNEYSLESIYKDGLRFIKVETRVGRLSISGKTSRDKWGSQSQLHNYIDAGKCHLKAIFRIISKDANPLIVQYQVIGD